MRWAVELFHQCVKQPLGFEEGATQGFDAVIAQGHWVSCAYLLRHLSPPGLSPGVQSIGDQHRALQQGVADLQLTDIVPEGDIERRYQSNFAPRAFEAAVDKCKEYIKAGDIFQVVLSQRLQTETTARPFDIYRTLRVVNPSPFMFYLKAGALALVGSSPEIMVRVEEDRVTIRPLAGTRPRGKNEEEDERSSADPELEQVARAHEPPCGPP